MAVLLRFRDRKRRRLLVRDLSSRSRKDRRIACPAIDLLRVVAASILSPSLSRQHPVPLLDLGHLCILDAVPHRYRRKRHFHIDNRAKLIDALDTEPAEAAKLASFVEHLPDQLAAIVALDRLHRLSRLRERCLGHQCRRVVSVARVAADQVLRHRPPDADQPHRGLSELEEPSTSTRAYRTRCIFQPARHVHHRAGHELLDTNRLRPTSSIRHAASVIRAPHAGDPAGRRSRCVLANVGDRRLNRSAL